MNVIQLSTIAWLKKHKEYATAKAGNIDAAYRLALSIFGNAKRLLKIKNLGLQYPSAIITGVHAEEETGRNKIPESHAKQIGILTGLEVDKEIVQKTRVYRTGKDEIYRLAYRPKFDGKVQAGREYILIDDVTSKGGTLSELNFYIEQNGGKVVQMVVAGAGRYSTNIALTEKTKTEIINIYGTIALQEFLKEHDIYAGNIGYLTESEARRIMAAGALNRTRDRIVKIRQAGNTQTD